MDRQVNGIKRGKMKGWRVPRYYIRCLGQVPQRNLKNILQKRNLSIWSMWHSKECDNAMDMVFNKKRANDRKRNGSRHIIDRDVLGYEHRKECGYSL